MEIKSTDAESASVRFLFGTAEFDPRKLELKVAGVHVDAQRKPLQILEQLVMNAGSIVTREQLLESVWRGRPIVDNVVASAVAKLRTVLGHENAAAIITHPRVGYRFEGTVQRIEIDTSTQDYVEFHSGMPVPHRDTLTLVTKLEGGSTHEVWTARHNSTQDLRVYKFCQADGGLNGLRREAALSQLLQQHLCERRDVARVLDWNFEKAPYFVGFEFGGVDLATWARSDGMLASLSRSERLDLFLEIAQAVEAVHRAGVIHQDLKPSNILLSRRSNGGWHARLSDFECSKLEQSDRLANFRITQFGLLDADTLTTPSSSATPIYVAPELLTGQTASKQSDVYALGVLLYQILVGDLQRPIAQGWERHIDDEFLRTDISDATDCDLAQRLSSVAELCSRLQEIDQRRAAGQQKQLAERASNLARETDMRRCARRLWVLATVVLVAIVVVQGTWLARIRSNARQASTPTACTPEAGLR